MRFLSCVVNRFHSGAKDFLITRLIRISHHHCHERTGLRCFCTRCARRRKNRIRYLIEERDFVRRKRPLCVSSWFFLLSLTTSRDESAATNKRNSSKHRGNAKNRLSASDHLALSP